MILELSCWTLSSKVIAPHPWDPWNYNVQASKSFLYRITFHSEVPQSKICGN
jgi:hypothetical protein